MEDQYGDASFEPTHGGHTQFLDLTNGEGGEKPSSSQSVESAAAAHSILEAVGTGDNVGDAAGMDSAALYLASAAATAATPPPHTSSTSTASSKAGRHRPPTSTSGHSKMADPTPPGRVIETGQEHTGRWTKEEHDAFLSALQTYGKEWKKVAAKVKTRTVVQTRTHAQKYFQKLQKSMELKGDGSVVHVDMGVAPESKKATHASATPGAGERGSRGGKKKKVSIAPKPHRRSSNTTMSAAQVITSLSNATTSDVGGNSLTFGNGSPVPTPPRHGFGSGWPGAGITITAPDPSQSRLIKFPEPSPAATGKRKLAEIAAARMLAGVGHPVSANHGGGDSGGASTDDMDGPPTPPPLLPPPLRLKDAPPPPPLFSGALPFSGGAPKGLSLQIVNPESLGVTFDHRRPKSDGESSPVTPWDGELEALVSEKIRADLLQEEAAAANSNSAPSAISAVPNNNATAKIRAMVTGSNATRLHPVNGPPIAYERSPLHQAVCAQDRNKLESLLELLSATPSHDNSNTTDANDDVKGPTLCALLHNLDEAGYAPIHSACAQRMTPSTASNKEDAVMSDANDEPDASTTSLWMLRRLLDAGADATLSDSLGNTPLHWAARAGDRSAVEALLDSSLGSESIPIVPSSNNGGLSVNIDAVNDTGETPLHWALRIGVEGAYVVQLLLERGANPSLLDKCFRRPIDVASEGFLDDEGSLASFRKRDQGKKLTKEHKKVMKLIELDKRDARANLLIRSPTSRTLVLHHPECLEHHTKSQADWEAPDRVTSILRRVTPDPADADAVDQEASPVFPHEVTVSTEFDRANLDLLSRVHSTDYLSFVNKLSKDLEKKLTGGVYDSDQGMGGSPPPVVPFTPMVQRTMIKLDEPSVKLGVNSDTSFSAGSLRAARRAAGAVQHAVDCVLNGRNRNSFCVVRPPGHHAGINGLLEGGESCGFCIFNNVAAGALHAISDEKLPCGRCAIVDIDVHHGNGTEEIVRKCHDPSKLFFFSIHLYDNEKKKRSANPYKFYPGTGDQDDLAMNIINVPIVPLWKDAVPPAVASVARKHNTRKKTLAAAATDDSSESSVAVASDGGLNPAMAPPPVASTSSIRNSSGSGRLAYRQAISSRLLPALRAFNPDLILISAGFDAANGDVGNARHERGRERMGLDLEPEDYAWTTRKILEIADICCDGKVVSVLEGGYGRTPVAPPGDSAHDESLDRRIFGECAVRHLHAMIDPYDNESRFSS